MSDSEEVTYVSVRVLVYTDNVDKPHAIVTATLDDAEAGELFSILGTICLQDDVTPRTLKMLRWCTARKMKAISSSLVTQIVVKFEGVEETLRLID